MLAERAASEGPRSTRAPEVSPFHPATSWGLRREEERSFDARSKWQPWPPPPKVRWMELKGPRLGKEGTTPAKIFAKLGVCLEQAGIK